MNSFVTGRRWVSVLCLVCILFLSACSATQPTFESSEVQKSVQDIVDPNRDYVIDAYDPWEGFNRRMYAFNTNFDRYFLIPIVDGYEFVTPEVAQQGVSNFFNNLDEIRNFLNSFLQFDMKATGTSLARFAINTTIGIAGLFDPATSFGLHVQRRDFGQTLGVYGVGPGPFLVLPVLGPSTVRDGVGQAVDFLPYTTLNPISPASLLEDEDVLFWTLSVLQAVDARSGFDFRYYQSGSPFEYDLVRLLYLTNRKVKIESVRSPEIAAEERKQMMQLPPELQ